MNPEKPFLGKRFLGTLRKFHTFNLIHYSLPKESNIISNLCVLNADVLITTRQVVSPVYSSTTALDSAIDLHYFCTTYASALFREYSVVFNALLCALCVG